MRKLLSFLSNGLNIIYKYFNMKAVTKEIETNSQDEFAIILDDEKDVRDSFENLFNDLDIELKLITCSTHKEYENLISQEDIRNQLRVLIMDLSHTLAEVESKTYKADEYIQEEYSKNRIPIFIHSANLQHYTKLEDKGTVFKIPKSKSSTEEICNSIKQMQDSKFLNIFCKGGFLENRIMEEIHTAFVEQFKGNEINQIIESIREVSKKDYEERTKEVFERIGIRAVFENWISTKLRDENFEEVRLNSIEHYFRRTSDYKIWTGDIFCKKDTDDGFSIILTPRCNAGHENFNEVLLCEITKINDDVIQEYMNPKKGKGLKSFRMGITDDVTNNRIGERFRFLPPTPQFVGGFVDYKTMFTVPLVKFMEENHRVISLSDELTNDVVRKFSAYILRGGISETNFEEAHFYLTNLSTPENKNDDEEKITVVDL